MPEGYHGRSGRPDIRWWIEQVSKGKEWRNKMAMAERWDTWTKWSRGQFDASILPSNLYSKVIRSIVPRTYFRNPSVSISATQPGLDHILLAKLLERADNKLLDFMDFKGQAKRSVLHGTMFGTGFWRRGYGAEFTATPAAITTDGPDVGGRRRAMKVEYNDLVQKDTPWMLCAHPGSMVLPVGVTDIHAARWTCFETYRPKNDLLRDPRFKVSSELAENIRVTNTQGRQVIQPWGKKPADGVLLWEIRDKKTASVFVIAPHGVNRNDSTPGEALFDEEDKLQRDGRLPVYPIIFNQDPECFWGVPDSIFVEPQQIEINEIRTQLKNHRRIMLLKMAYTKGMISPDELDKLLADDNVNIAVQMSGNPNSDLRVLEPIPLPSGLVEMGALIDQEVEQIIGLGVNQFGEYAPGSSDRSATEANIVNSATQIRIDERRDAVADQLTAFVNDMNTDIAELWDEPMVVDVAGPQSVPLWVKFQPELLKNNRFEVHVDPDSSVPMTKQYKEQKALAGYQLFSQNPRIDQNALLEFTLSQIWGFDADFLINAAAQTSPQNPMTLQEATQHLQAAAPNARPRRHLNVVPPAAPGVPTSAA